MISRRLDVETGIIYVSGEGIWTESDVDTHYQALSDLIEPIRSAGKRVRILSDIRGATRQTPEIESHILLRMSQVFQAGDRVVMLTADLDDKLYTRHLVHDIDVAVFSSLLPAEMWLLSDDLPKIA